jgi:hypothetical protein
MVIETSGQSETSTTDVASGTFDDPHIVALSVGTDKSVEYKDVETQWAAFKVGNYVRFVSDFGTVHVTFNLKSGGELPFGKSSIEGEGPYQLVTVNNKWVGECKITGPNGNTYESKKGSGINPCPKCP